MRAKKTPRTKDPKPAVRGKRKIGLTSAIGPKATTAVVCVVLAGGLWFGSHLSAKGKTPTPSVETEITDMTPAPATPVKAATTAKAHDSNAAPAAASPSAAPKSAKGSITTIEGCLERDGDTFRLKDTSGADAPKSRSWKSGFLKKGGAAVDVLDPAESFGLANRLGTRVSVTGTLTDRQIQARAIHRIASSCN